MCATVEQAAGCFLADALCVMDAFAVEAVSACQIDPAAG
ncbi:Uncharacterised protein [Burkholderia pseudomallei]|nr:Uncharacterised protein [Burkholderia pseudomallei]